MPLFVDYTTVFDDLASTVDFKPTEGSKKGKIKNSATPKQALRLLTDFEISEQAEYVAKIFSQVTFFIVIAVYFFFLYWYFWPGMKYSSVRWAALAFESSLFLVLAYYASAVVHSVVIEDFINDERKGLDVDTPGKAILKVRLSQSALLSFISVFLRKLCSRTEED